MALYGDHLHKLSLSVCKQLGLLATQPLHCVPKTGLMLLQSLYIGLIWI